MPKGYSSGQGLYEDILPGGHSYAHLAHAAMRDKAFAPEGGKNRIADRAAYMAYLEQQLERVTASCKTVQSYNERLDSVQDAVAQAESKIAANTRLSSIAQILAERVEEEMSSFKELLGRKFQRMDSSIKDALDVDEEMVRRLERLEEAVDNATKASREAEEKVMAALARHSDQSEDRLATFEKRIAAMLSQQRDEVKRVVDSAGKSAAETVSSMTEERRGDMKDRQKFHQTVLDEMRERAEHWDRCSGDLFKRIEKVEEAARKTTQEVTVRAEGEVERLRTEMREGEREVADQVRNGLHIIRDIEGKLTREVHHKLDALAASLRGLEEARAETEAASHPLFDAARHDADQILARLARLEEDARERGDVSQRSSSLPSMNVQQERLLGAGVIAALRGEGNARRFTQGGVKAGSESSEDGSIGPETPPGEPKGRPSPTKEYAGAIDRNKERRRRRLKELYKELSSLEIEERGMGRGPS